jgi:hypothetical protein
MPLLNIFYTFRLAATLLCAVYSNVLDKIAVGNDSFSLGEVVISV